MLSRILLAVCLVPFVYTAMSKSAPQSQTEIDWAMLLPDDEGRNSVLSNCANCHGLDRIVLQRRDKDFWLATIGRMAGDFGANVPEEEIEPIADYLARHAGENNPVTEVPMDINTVAESGLRRLRFLSNLDVNRILQYRLSRKFQSIADVEKLLESNPEQASRLRVYVAVRKSAESPEKK